MIRGGVNNMHIPQGEAVGEEKKGGGECHGRDQPQEPFAPADLEKKKTGPVLRRADLARQRGIKERGGGEEKKKKAAMARLLVGPTSSGKRKGKKKEKMRTGTRIKSTSVFCSPSFAGGRRRKKKKKKKKLVHIVTSYLDTCQKKERKKGKKKKGKGGGKRGQKYRILPQAIPSLFIRYLRPEREGERNRKKEGPTEAC